ARTRAAPVPLLSLEVSTMALSLFDRLLKSKSRTVSRRRPARARLGLEALERRELLTVTPNIQSGFLVVSGDSSGNTITVVLAGHSSANTITVAHTGSTTIINAAGFADSQITNDIQINSGSGNDKIKLLPTVKPVDIKGFGGSDTVTISDARNIAANVFVSNS